jgi:hypothetical protein
MSNKYWGIKLEWTNIGLVYIEFIACVGQRSQMPQVFQRCPIDAILGKKHICLGIYTVAIRSVLD